MYESPDRLRDIRSALAVIPAASRETWWRVGMALKSEPSINGEAFGLFDEWSRTASNYNEQAAKDVWRSLSPDGGITIATLFRHCEKSTGTRQSARNRHRRKRHGTSAPRAVLPITSTWWRKVSDRTGRAYPAIPCWYRSVPLMAC